MDAELQNMIWSRAGDRCEYCHLPTHAAEFSFHIEHIVAQQHGGETVAENLAVACPRCNYHKGTNLSSVDSQTGRKVWLFHPRRQRWAEHFRWRGLLIVGKTATGRATVSLLKMNTHDELERRLELKAERRFLPPDDVRRRP